MGQGGKLDEILCACTGHVSEGQVETLQISKRAGLEQSCQIVILGKKKRTLDLPTFISRCNYTEGLIWVLIHKGLNGMFSPVI